MKLCAAIGAAVVTVALAATPALVVDEGVPDKDRHPYVGALGVDMDGDGPQALQAWCTGFVISDRAFVTAGHCLNGLGPEAVWYVTLAAGSPRRR